MSIEKGSGGTDSSSYALEAKWAYWFRLTQYHPNQRANAFYDLSNLWDIFSTLINMSQTSLSLLINLWFWTDPDQEIQWSSNEQSFALYAVKIVRNDYQKEWLWQFTKQFYYKEYCLQGIKRSSDTVRRKRPHLWKSADWVLHHDGASVHPFDFIQNFLVRNLTALEIKISLTLYRT